MGLSTGHDSGILCMDAGGKAGEMNSDRSLLDTNHK